MQLYARQGRRGAALRQYQVCVGVMQRELGVEPEEKTRALYQEILEGVPAADLASITTASASTAPRAPMGADPGAATPVADLPLIGRAAERKALRDAWNEVRLGRGRTVALLGEAGIGKSRLVSDLVAAVSGADRPRVLLGRAHDSEQILPFGPWVDAFRVGQVTTELALQRDANTFWATELARLFPELGLPDRDVTDAEGYRRLFEAIAHAIGHFATPGPLLLILEDVHWADEMTLRLLAFMSRRLSSWPVLLLATARSEHFIDMPLLGRTFSELSRDARFLSLSLSPLSEPETVSLVGTLSRAGTADPTVQRLGEQIWRVSEGNPFMVVETMRARYEEKEWAAAEELRTPTRVRDVIASRLERVSERARKLVALASVIGRDFDFILLDRAAELGTRATAEAVEELVGRRILHAVGERLDFTHDRIREVAYDQLIAPSQRLQHAAVAQAIEEVYRDQLESHCGALGRHYRRAGSWEKAALYLHQAGLVAAKHAAHRHATTCFEQALEALQHLPDRRDRTKRSAASSRAPGSSSWPER
jgi:predicted ATPase